jgi:Rieske Fe-S protein
MPLDEDKYPDESGRRRFVKGVVGSAALASVGTGGFSAVTTATAPSGIGGGTTPYVAIENTDGPAPRGMPVVPVEINSADELKGVWPETSEEEIQGRTVQVAEMDLGGVTYSTQWFQFCGVQQYQGAQPAGDQDNAFRAAPGAPYDWMEDLDQGQKLTVDMFSDYDTWTNLTENTVGKPAKGSWRSQGEDVKTLPIQVVRSPEIPKLIDGETSNATGKDYSELPQGVRDFMDAATEQDFMAWLNKCTHFCCVPGFKQLAGSASFGAADEVYCQCHQSVYDPFSPVQKQFVALPRPEE